MRHEDEGCVSQQEDMDKHTTIHQTVCTECETFQPLRETDLFHSAFSGVGMIYLPPKLGMEILQTALSFLHPRLQKTTLGGTFISSPITHPRGAFSCSTVLSSFFLHMHALAFVSPFTPLQEGWQACQPVDVAVQLYVRTCSQATAQLTVFRLTYSI